MSQRDLEAAVDGTGLDLHLLPGRGWVLYKDGKPLCDPLSTRAAVWWVRGWGDPTGEKEGRTEEPLSSNMDERWWLTGRIARLLQDMGTKEMN